MIFTVTKPAEHDLEDIGDFIAVNNPLRAISYVEDIETACLNLLGNPAAYPIIKSLGDDIRRAPFQRYLIFCTASDFELKVVRILHSARDINPQMLVS